MYYSVNFTLFTALSGDHRKYAYYNGYSKCPNPGFNFLLLSESVCKLVAFMYYRKNGHFIAWTRHYARTGHYITDAWDFRLEYCSPEERECNAE